MFGNRTLNKSTIKVNAEGLEQYKIVASELDKLATLTQESWDLTSTKLFNKVRVISFLEGAAVFAAGQVAMT